MGPLGEAGPYEAVATPSSGRGRVPPVTPVRTGTPHAAAVAYNEGFVRPVGGATAGVSDGGVATPAARRAFGGGSPVEGGVTGAPGAMRATTQTKAEAAPRRALTAQRLARGPPAAEGARPAGPRLRGSVGTARAVASPTRVLVAHMPSSKASVGGGRGGLPLEVIGAAGDEGANQRETARWSFFMLARACGGD